MIRAAVRRGVPAAVGAGFALALLLAGPAAAVPPGGPGADTPGTSAEVSPTSLSAGDKISFTVHGFPAGETINVKIDDGEVCGEDAVHGACVVHKQQISSGSTEGSFRLPKDLKEGPHTLRFLASQEIKGSGGGVNGFTLRSPEFTIASAQESQPEPTAAASQSVEQQASEAPKTKKSKKASEAPKTTKASSDDVGMVTPAPVTAVVTGAGLSVAQAIGIGGAAVGLAAVIGGFTAWWRRGGLG